MSVVAQSWAWKFYIPSVPKLVLIALADQSDDDGEVRYRDVSADFFSQKCGMTVRNFRRHIQALELNGYLRRAVGGGRGHGTEFFLELGRTISPLNEWQQPEIHPKETDKELPEETRTEMSGFSDEKPGQLRQETRTTPVRNPDMAVRVSASIHNTRDQSTKESTSARARASGVGARAHAREEPGITAEDFKVTKELLKHGQWVYRGSRGWNDLAELALRHGILMPQAVYTRANDPPHKNGRHFPKWLWQRALDEAAPSRGPPDADPVNEGGMESERGIDNAQRQSAAGLRGAEGSLDNRADRWSRGGRSIDGGSGDRLAP